MYSDKIPPYTPPDHANAVKLFASLVHIGTPQSLHRAGELMGHCDNQRAGYPSTKSRLENCRELLDAREKGRQAWDQLAALADKGDVLAMIYYADLPLSIVGRGMDQISSAEWLCQWKVRQIKYLEQAVSKGSRTAARMIMHYYLDILEPADNVQGSAWMRAFMMRVGVMDQSKEYLDPLYKKMTDEQISRSIALAKSIYKDLPDLQYRYIKH